MSYCAMPGCHRPKHTRVWCFYHSPEQTKLRREQRAANAKPFWPDNNTCFNNTVKRCEKIRQNDEWYCGRCHRIWPVDEGPPPCEETGTHANE